MRDIVITSSVLITAVLLIRFLARGKISPILQYALWLPVALRLMLPVPLWESSISVLNILPDSFMRENTDSITDSAAGNDMQDVSADNAADRLPVNAANDGAANGNVAAAGSNMAAADTVHTDTVGNPLAADSENDYPAAEASSQSGQASGNITDGSAADDGAGISPALTGAIRSGLFGTALTLLWITGMVCSGGYMLFYQIKWKKYLRENARPLKGREKYRDKLSVYTVKGLPSPCLSGRNIYLTKEMASDERRLEHILMHEYCHYRHLDSIWVIVRCILTAVYWFHPLVWAAAYLSKQDSELACDEAALRRLGEKERIAYGKTLLALIVEEPFRRNRIGIASTMSGGEKGIRERIFRIAKKRNYIAAVSGIVILLAAALVAVTFSGKGEDADNLADTDKALTDDMGEKTQAGESQAELQAYEEELKALQEEVEKEKLMLEEAIEEEKRKVEAMEALYADEERSKSILSKLSAYDERIITVDSREDIPDAKIPAHYVQTYYQDGTDALDEDIYLLESKRASAGSDIKIYGMYTKDYGFRGIKFLIGGDVTNFDEPWILSAHGREDNIAVYELAEDGMPRIFACKMAEVNTGSSEIWNLYLCDRYDTGTIAMFTPDREEFLKQIQERISFDILPSECKIEVYDNGKRIGSIAVPASVSSMEKIGEVICDGTTSGYVLGNDEKEIRLMIAVGLKTGETDEIWYRGLNLLSFPVECGNFGERKFQIGEAAIDTESINGILQSAQSIDEWIEAPKEISEDILAQAFRSTEGHHDVAIHYQNPCPGATRIAVTFGERVHPVTQEKIVHSGIDLAAPIGSDVLAAADGVVLQTGYDYTSGNYVVLYHEQSGECTYYAACQEILVSKLENVKAGDKIATVGSTGRSVGAHLHFALSKDGKYIEPVFEGLEAFE